MGTEYTLPIPFWFKPHPLSVSNIYFSVIGIKSKGSVQILYGHIFCYIKSSKLELFLQVLCHQQCRRYKAEHIPLKSFDYNSTMVNSNMLRPSPHRYFFLICRYFSTLIFGLSYIHTYIHGSLTTEHLQMALQEGDRKDLKLVLVQVRFCTNG